MYMYAFRYERPLLSTQHTRSSILQAKLCSFNKSRFIRVFMSTTTLLEPYCRIRYRTFKKTSFHAQPGRVVYDG